MLVAAGKNLALCCCAVGKMSDQILAGLLAAKGLTIIKSFPVQLFNSQGCPPEHQLPTFERQSTLGIIIANTNALWPHFIQHLATSPETLKQAHNPLDQYVEAVVEEAVQRWRRQADPQQHPTTATACLLPHGQGVLHKGQEPAHSTNTSAQMCSSSSNTSSNSNRTNGAQRCPQVIVRFSHHTEPGRFVNMMRAAELSGLAYYSSTTHLCMHPVFGPWFALRAVAVVDADGPNIEGFTPLPCPHPDLEEEAAQQMRRLKELGGFSNWQQHWQDWAALRALGGKYTDPRFAYCEDQLEYHYTKNKEVLVRAVAALQQSQGDQT